MNRRDFLRCSVAAGVVAAVPFVASVPNMGVPGGNQSRAMQIWQKELLADYKQYQRYIGIYRPVERVVRQKKQGHGRFMSVPVWHESSAKRPVGVTL